MEFITDYNLTGLLLGLCSFLIIGLFHPLVVKGEYYLGVRCWWGFLLLGIAACVCSVLANGFFVQTLIFGQNGILKAPPQALTEIYTVVGIVCLLGVIRHQSNIRRLLNGTENKVSVHED